MVYVVPTVMARHSRTMHGKRGLRNDGTTSSGLRFGTNLRAHCWGQPPGPRRLCTPNGLNTTSQRLPENGQIHSKMALTAAESDVV